MREKVLLGGEFNTSKTLSLISLAFTYPDRKVVILDPDDGVAKVVEELGAELPNLTVIPVTPNWMALLEQYRMIKTVLTADDWLCFDMMGRFWDFAQNYYSRTVFGGSLSEHLMELSRQAKATNFNGFDGLSNWPTIKRMHNEDLVDDALLWSPFNVMATTSISQYLPVEKVPKGGIEGILASEFGIKLEGEKHNYYRFDTQAILYRKKDGSFNFRLYKDKGRHIDIKQEFNITGSNFWDKYLEFRGRTE